MATKPRARSRSLLRRESSVGTNKSYNKSSTMISDIQGGEGRGGLGPGAEAYLRVTCLSDWTIDNASPEELLFIPLGKTVTNSSAGTLLSHTTIDVEAFYKPRGGDTPLAPPLPPPREFWYCW